LPGIQFGQFPRHTSYQSYECFSYSSRPQYY
jgi:hypothetical protein